MSSQHPGGFPTVAVVGDGQLARMMAEAAGPLGVRLRLLAGDPDSSAAQVIPDVVLGSHTEEADVRQVADGVAALTFDHEHVPTEILRRLQQDGYPVGPPPQALVHAQDKLVMRERLGALLGEDGLAANPHWARVRSAVEVADFAAEVGGWPVVVKTPRGGYDGKGVVVASGPKDVPADWFERFSEGLLAEQKVDFTRELAVLVARSPSGQAAAWPVVQTIQVDSICDEVIAPAPGLSPELAAAATEVGLRIAGELGVTGVMAVEGFETGDGRFLVNELAMRPHNSGHWTIEGAVTSQFEQHLRAVLDLPLGQVHSRAPWTVMVNVLGGQYPDLYRSYLHVMARDPGAKVHMYGKGVRPGRKLGHVTVCGDDLDDVRARARHAADFIKGVIDE
ncbi:MAG: 5-(carboxyamino)imidazole ribonucleotide synthase [Actinomycetales bacterium]